VGTEASVLTVCLIYHSAEEETHTLFRVNRVEELCLSHHKRETVRRREIPEC